MFNNITPDWEEPKATPAYLSGLCKKANGQKHASSWAYCWYRWTDDDSTDLCPFLSVDLEPSWSLLWKPCIIVAD